MPVLTAPKNGNPFRNDLRKADNTWKEKFVSTGFITVLWRKETTANAHMLTPVTTILLKDFLARAGKIVCSLRKLFFSNSTKDSKRHEGFVFE